MILNQEEVDTVGNKEQFGCRTLRAKHTLRTWQLWGTGNEGRRSLRAMNIWILNTQGNVYTIC